MLVTSANAFVRPTPDMTLKAALVATAGKSLLLVYESRWFLYGNSVLIPKFDGISKVGASSISGLPKMKRVRDKR